MLLVHPSVSWAQGSSHHQPTTWGNGAQSFISYFHHPYPGSKHTDTHTQYSRR